MKRYTIFALMFILMLASKSIFAQYTLHCFDSTGYLYTDIPVSLYPSPATPHVVYCGDSFVYISNKQALILDHLLRMDVNMVLKANGEYVDSPCF